MDYELSRLDPRRFEQLVQDISVQVLGADVVVFGDGPDGGREAAFSGKRQIPGTEKIWDGSGVVQAKFKQRSEGTSKDQEWAFRQLRRELVGYRSRFLTRRQPPPDYFIFATNVVLTPQGGGGGKDRVTEELEQFKPSEEASGFKDFLIWDYDQLRTFIDLNQSIREGFSPFILPGDVLAKLLGPTKANVEKTLSSLMHTELINQQYVTFDQASRSEHEKLQVAKVFVDLPASLRVSASAPTSNTGSEIQADDESLIDLRTSKDVPIVKTLLERSRFPLAPANAESSRPTLAADESVQRFVLVGGPGQGKSTVGQLLCQLHRAAFLRDRPSDAVGQSARQALDLIEQACDRQGLTLPATRRLPFHVSLASYAEALSESPGLSIIQYLAGRITKETDVLVSAFELREWFSWPWLVVLDGLDEVPSSANRRDLLQAIDSFWTTVEEVGGDVFLLVTTRPQGYSSELEARGFSRYELSHLSLHRALEYAGLLVASRHPGNKELQDRTIKRIQSAANTIVSNLLNTPLHITMLTALVEQYGAPPKHRYQLFEKYYDKVYDRERVRELPSAESLKHVLQNNKALIDEVHRRVGYALHVQSELKGGTDSYMSQQQLHDVVVDLLRRYGHEDDESINELSETVVNCATDRLVFLVGTHIERLGKADQLGFELRSLQEFMAAEKIMHERDQTELFLRRIAPSAHWRNVFLFAAGSCFTDLKLPDTVLAVCNTLNRDEEQPLAMVSSAGSTLALELLEEGVASEKPKYEREFTHIASALLDIPEDVEAHRRLADSVTRDTMKTLIRELVWRLQSPGSATGAARCLFRLAERNPTAAIEVLETAIHQGLINVVAMVQVINEEGLPTSLVQRVVKLIESTSSPDAVAAICQIIASATKKSIWRQTSPLLRAVTELGALPSSQLVSSPNEMKRSWHIHPVVQHSSDALKAVE